MLPQLCLNVRLYLRRAVLFVFLLFILIRGLLLMILSTIVVVLLSHVLWVKE
jgi:hypothetical protein